MGGVQSSRVTVSELDRAARQVVASALATQPDERVVIIGDASSVRMTDALARAAEERDAIVRVLWLDDLGVRPLDELGHAATHALREASASIFVAGAPVEELLMRKQLLGVVTEEAIRHAHMPAISHLAFVRGLRVDYDVVHGHGMRLLSRLSETKRIVATSPAGTMLLVENTADVQWLPQLGQLEPGRWGNLPAGALYAAPLSVRGVLVANAAVGGGFGRSNPPPIHVYLDHGRVDRVEVPADADLERRIGERLSEGPDSNRVALATIGCNYGIQEPTGEAIVDQNLPGLHLAIGDTASSVTGLSWTTKSSVPFCGAGADVLLDGEAVIRRGALVEPS